MDSQKRKSALKTAQMLILVAFVFQLGHYDVEFSGTGVGWTALILNVAICTLILFQLIRDFWKSNA